MSALTFNLMRLAYLVLLWLFVLAAIGVLRRDLLTRGRAARKANAAAAGSGAALVMQPGMGSGDVVGYEAASGYATPGYEAGYEAGYLGDGGGMLPGAPPVADLPVTVVGGGATLPEPIVVGPAAAPAPMPESIVVGPAANVAGGSVSPPMPVAPTPSGLAVTAGALAGTWIPLFADAITIGRGPENTLVLEDGYASGKHARIYPQDGQWYLEDLNSTNGTLLAGQRVHGVVPLPLGVPVKIGGSEIELVS